MTNLMISPAPKTRCLRARGVVQCNCMFTYNNCKNCGQKSSNWWERRCRCIRMILRKQHMLKKKSLERKRSYRESYYDSRLIPFHLRGHFIHNGPSWLISKRIVNIDGCYSSSTSSGDETD